MRVLNHFLYTRDQYSINKNWHGRVDGLTYTATADGQYFLPWVNIPSAGNADRWVALISDETGSIKPGSGSTQYADGLMTTTVFSWGNGLLMDKDASLTFVMRGSYTSEDWQVMQALGIPCWDKDSAPY